MIEKAIFDAINIVPPNVDTSKSDVPLSEKS